MGTENAGLAEAVAATFQFANLHSHEKVRLVGLGTTIPNPLLDKILLSAPATAGEEVHVGDASPAELFDDLRRVTVKRDGRVQVTSFYTYDGSLTTPGCSQNVRWSLPEARSRTPR